MLHHKVWLKVFETENISLTPFRRRFCYSAAATAHLYTAFVLFTLNQAAPELS